MRILHLTLKRKWFDKIASGEKKVEYRQVKSYWDARLRKPYEEIHFKNGYSADAPFMRVEYMGIAIKKVPDFSNQPYYCIKLGEVLEIRR